MKILVVENSPLVRRLIFNTLTRAGITDLILADSGRTALNRLEGEIPQLIIIGTDLSGMSGLQFALKVRMSDRYGHVSMIMVSQRSTYADVFNAVKCGIDNYLVMPFAEEALIDKVRSTLSVTVPTGSSSLSV